MVGFASVNKEAVIEETRCLSPSNHVLDNDSTAHSRTYLGRLAAAALTAAERARRVVITMTGAML